MHVGMFNQRAKTEMTNAFDLVVDARYLGQMMSGFEKNIFIKERQTKDLPYHSSENNTKPYICVF